MVRKTQKRLLLESLEISKVIGDEKKGLWEEENDREYLCAYAHVVCGHKAPEVI